MLIVVLFDFLNIKSVKIYAIPFIFSTTLLFYKLDTLLLKQKNLPVLDIMCFFFRIRTQVTALVLRTSAFTRVLMRKKEPAISNTGHFFCFNSTVSYASSIAVGRISTRQCNTESAFRRARQMTNDWKVSKIK